MATVDLIPAPAGDAVTFRLRRSRLWLRMALILIPVFLLIRGTAIGLSLEEWDFTETVTWVLLTAIAGATGAVLGAGRNLGWIRASAAGLEFAATRHTPVFLPWSAVLSIRLRFTGPLTELLITPTSLNAAAAAAAVAAVPARAPRVRRRSGAAAFIVDVGLMTPGPPALLAELNRRLAAHR
jgi:hypothetical protein